MALPTAPATVTVYDVVKDLGFPAVVALILLFQIGPKLDQVAQKNATVTTELGAVASICTPKPGTTTTTVTP